MDSNKNERLKKYQELIYKATQLRREQGKTLQNIADNMGVAQPSIARFESMNHDVKVGTLLAYLDALDCTLEIIPKKKLPNRSNTAVKRDFGIKAETADTFENMTAQQFIRLVMYAKELIEGGGIEIVPNDTEK